MAWLDSWTSPCSLAQPDPYPYGLRKRVWLRETRARACVCTQAVLTAAHQPVGAGQLCDCECGLLVCVRIIISTKVSYQLCGYINAIHKRISVLNFLMTTQTVSVIFLFTDTVCVTQMITDTVTQMITDKYKVNMEAN